MYFFTNIIHYITRITVAFGYCKSPLYWIEDKYTLPLSKYDLECKLEYIQALKMNRQTPPSTPTASSNPSPPLPDVDV